MPLAYLMKGFLVGLLVAVPVGPVAILCMQRTLKRGRMVGFVSGLGAASAEAVFCFLAAFSFTYISNIFIEQRFLISLCSGLFLCLLGLRAFFSIPVQQNQNQKNSNFKLIGSFGSTFLVTITNPITIFVFIAIFALFNIILPDTDSSLIFCLGSACGSILWWTSICRIVSIFRDRISDLKLSMLYKLSGLVMVVIGIGIILTNLQLYTQYNTDVSAIESSVSPLAQIIKKVLVR